MASEIDVLHAIVRCEQLSRELPTAPAGWIVTQVAEESGVDENELGVAWTRKLIAAATARSAVNRPGAGTHLDQRAPQPERK